ncbi:MAG: IS630 family transposase [Planctomycetes bacterium]|nr:IS630 family transposase [Planctomycetota bacterium]
MIDRAVELKMEQPHRSVDDINQLLQEEFQTSIPKSTLYRYFRRAGATRLAPPPSQAKVKGLIKTITPRDRQILEQWRHSSNKRLWEGAVAILDSCDSTVEEISEKIERSVQTVYRWVRLYKRHGAEGLRRSPKVAGPGLIKTISPRDRQILEQWRKSNNKILWDKAVTILDSSGSTVEEICAKTERSRASVFRWAKAFNDHGIEGLRRRSRDRTNSNQKLEIKTRRIFEILHDRPMSFGINRSNWSLRSLATAYRNRHGEAISASTIGRLMKGAGYRFRKARRVLTSPDPNYREKVELLLETLQSLKPTELLFFVDELGPLRVKSYGGRCYAPKKKPPTYVDRQKSRGSITLFGALSATTNQVTWFYGKSKDTEAMIDLAEILFNQHHDRSRLYITWDAASWHSSNALTSWLDAFNAQTRELGNGPIIEFLPLPSRSQFLDVIEAAFSGMKRAVIHHSDYASEYEMKSAISAHFVERNEYFKHNPRRAGKKIWEIDFFNDFKNILGGDYREW